MDINSTEKAFCDSPRKHIVNITNHGIHEWELTPGLQDTGGQNIFVNEFADELVRKNCKVTIINRGGFPHPETGKIQSGLSFKNPFQRIFYLEDNLPSFVRKEDMGERIPNLFDALRKFIAYDKVPIDLLVTHYWDAGLLGLQLQGKILPNLKHIWIPHSLGAIKEKMITQEQKSDLRIHERIAAEKMVLEKVDGVGVTSGIIRDSLHHDYDYQGKTLWLPPCVDINRYHKREIGDDAPVWELLRQHSELPVTEIRQRLIISEISRTDHTKRKDVLIKAFAEVHKTIKNTFLIISINHDKSELTRELNALIDELHLRDSIAVVGSVWEVLPEIYAISDIYCTPSIMEGFGMSAQEAAATSVPIVASDKVVFATEYLLGANVNNVTYAPNRSLQVGEGAVVVPVDDVKGFSTALTMLLKDKALRKSMGEDAFSKTIPYFTFDNIITDFLNEING
ncbi:MAG: glycosyltransferase [Anaerolineaceae bacterium]|nr:glycosyltransferase [Anaerolineaceae bacterium]